jgi:hypothetical protein
VLIVVDEDSIEPVEGLAAKQAARKFLDHLAPNDRVGVVTIPRLRSEVTLSTRRSDTLKSLDAVNTGVNVDLYEHAVGLSEAFAIERGESDVARQVLERECKVTPPELLPKEGGRRPPLDPDCPPAVMVQAKQVALQAHLRGQGWRDPGAGRNDRGVLGREAAAGVRGDLLEHPALPGHDGGGAEALR